MSAAPVRRIGLRVVTTLPVLWVVVTVVFLMIHLVPGDPIVQMLGDGASSGDVAGLRHAYGLDVPLGTQYVRYWSGLLHGNLGQSLRLHDSVLRLILSAVSVHAGADGGGDGDWGWDCDSGGCVRPRGGRIVGRTGRLGLLVWWGFRFRILRWGRF